MPTTIQVILQQDIHNLGKTGEVVKVRPGFARNYLLPKALASAATLKNVNRLEHEKKVAAARNAKAKAEMTELATKIGATAISLTRKAGEEGKLFGSITAQDIADGLKAQGLEVDRRRIELEHPIKTLGFHSVAVRLHPDVHAEVKVNVVAE